MNRRGALVILGLGALSARAVAQPRAKIPRIGFLSIDEPQLSLEPFRQGLRQLGYTEGENIALDVRLAMKKIGQLDELARDLVQQRVDVFVAGGSIAVGAAQRATKTIPIVMTQTSDAVGSGFVANLARPGGNTTGITSHAGELGARRLQLIKQLVPKATHVGILTNPANPSHLPGIKVLRGAARSLGMELYVVQAREVEDFQDAFSAMIKAGVQVFLPLPDNVTFNQRDGVVKLVARDRLPAVYWRREFVDAGGLICYGTDNPAQYRQAAAYVDKILKGAKPGELAVEQVSKYEVVVNLKTAKALGIEVPQTVLVQVTDAIK